MKKSAAAWKAFKRTPLFRYLSLGAFYAGGYTKNGMRDAFMAGRQSVKDEARRKELTP